MTQEKTRQVEEFLKNIGLVEIKDCKVYENPVEGNFYVCQTAQDVHRLARTFYDKRPEFKDQSFLQENNIMNENKPVNSPLLKAFEKANATNKEATTNKTKAVLSKLPECTINNLKRSLLADADYILEVDVDNGTHALVNKAESFLFYPDLCNLPYEYVTLTNMEEWFPTTDQESVKNPLYLFEKLSTDQRTQVQAMTNWILTNERKVTIDNIKNELARLVLSCKPKIEQPEQQQPAPKVRTRVVTFEDINETTKEIDDAANDWCLSHNATIKSSTITYNNNTMNVILSLVVEIPEE